MSTARIQDIVVPLVYVQDVEVDLIGQEGRTATGRMRRQTDAIKREWQLQTRPMLNAAALDLTLFLDSVSWGPIEFWLDEFGPITSTVRAFVTIEETREFNTPARRSFILNVQEE